MCQKPAHRGEALAPGLDLLGQALVLDLQQLIASKVALRQRRAGKQLVPTLDHLAQRPGIGKLRIYMQNLVGVVLHDRVATDLDGEDLAQFQQPVFDPTPAVLEGATGVSILAAQEGTAHAARDAVVVGGGFQADQRFPWLGHGRGSLMSP